jgi:hypothetical protein
MRYALILTTVLCACSVASADEVELKLQTVEVDNPLGVIKSDKHQLETITRPKGVTAPSGKGGKLVWYRLLLGKYRYLVCIIEKSGKKGKLTRLFLDKDGDKDLKEETPVEAKLRWGNPYFIVDGVTGEFKVGDNSVTGKMRVWIVPAAGGNLFFSTGLLGEISVEGKKFTLAWVPGNKPYFLLASWKEKFFTLCVGNKKLSVNAKSIAVKDGKVLATYKIKEDKKLIEVKVPSGKEGLTTVELLQQPNTVACMPSDGRVFLPGGMYPVAWATFDKKSEGASYSLNILLQGFEVKEGTTISPAEPLELALSVQQSGNRIAICASLTDASKRPAFVYKDGELAKPPTLKIINPEGEEVVACRLKPCRGGWSAFVWQVPDELKGRDLKVELEFEKTPFKIDIQSATFKVKK